MNRDTPTKGFALNPLVQTPDERTSNEGFSHTAADATSFIGTEWVLVEQIGGRKRIGPVRVNHHEVRIESDRDFPLSGQAEATCGIR